MVKPCFMDTRLIQTPHLLCLGKESPYIFSKFNLLNTNTQLIRTLSMAPLVTVLAGFDCNNIIVITQNGWLHYKSSTT